MHAYAIFVIDQLVKERRADLAATSTQHPSSGHPGRFAAIRSTLHGVADRMGHVGHHGSLTDAPITH